MNLLTKAIEAKLRKNWDAEAGTKVPPALKLFNPAGAGTWLLTELKPDDENLIAFGLCDLGMGSPELGYVSLKELGEFKGRFGLGIERDMHFNPRGKTLAEYTDEANAKGGIRA